LVNKKAATLPLYSRAGSNRLLFIMKIVLLGTEFGCHVAPSRTGWVSAQIGVNSCEFEWVLLDVELMQRLFDLN